MKKLVSLALCLALAAALSAQSLAAGTAEIVRAFAAALAQGAGERTRFILTTFGDAFALAEEDVPGEDLAERVGPCPSTRGSPGSTPPSARPWTTSRTCPGRAASCGAWCSSPMPSSTTPRGACPTTS